MAHPINFLQFQNLAIFTLSEIVPASFVDSDLKNFGASKVKDNRIKLGAVGDDDVVLIPGSSSHSHSRGIHKLKRMFFFNSKARTQTSYNLLRDTISIANILSFPIPITQGSDNIYNFLACLSPTLPEHNQCEC